MKMMLGATSCASWNSCRTRASDSPGTHRPQVCSQHTLVCMCSQLVGSLCGAGTEGLNTHLAVKGQEQSQRRTQLFEDLLMSHV